MDAILSPFMWILGYILKGIDYVVAITGYHNMGVCIIIFTVIVNILMYPLTLKQQKTAKFTSLINPEIKAIQNKYKGKKDNASMQKQQMETQEVYNRYGISPFGGCLPLLVTMPILFALFRVIDPNNITNYVPHFTGNNVLFLGLNLTQTPTNPISHGLNWTIIIPILAVVTQFASTKVMSIGQPSTKDAPGGDTMKMMNWMMPIISGVFCFSMGMGVGIYWITGNLFRLVQSIFINRKFNDMDMDAIAEQNKGKAAKKNAKRAEMNKRVAEYSKAKTSNKNYNVDSNKTKSGSTKDLNVNKNFEPGSISGIAHMMEGNKKKDDK